MVNLDQTISSILRYTPLNILETRILLSHVLQLPYVKLITNSERLLSVTEYIYFNYLLKKRLNGEPIAYLTGKKEFFSLTFMITPGVFIPRPETELLVDLGLQLLPEQKNQVLDMGTGSGAIAVSMVYTRPKIIMTALDNSIKCIKIAKQNAQNHATKINFIYSDWYSVFNKTHTTFDMIIANPPYIHAHDHHLQKGDLRFEPKNALTDHANGLSALYTIINGATQYLKKDGWLLLEHGYNQADIVCTKLTQSNFKNIQSWFDLAQIKRVSGGQKI